MAKKYFCFFIYLVFAIFLVIVPNKVRAADKVAYSLSCLSVENYYRPSCSKEKKANCIDYPTDIPHPDPSHKDHELKLTSAKLTTSGDVYIVACVETSGNFRCSTGDQATDEKLKAALGFDAQLATEIQQSFAVVGTNPRGVDSEGKIIVNARSYTKKNTNHAFYAVYKYLGGEDVSGNASSLQYGTIDFENDAKKCASVRWDPDGRVFDSKSLEPLPNAAVTLLDKDKKMVIKPGITNPNITALSGVFNFFIEAGTYYLNVLKNGYKFPALANVHPNYSKAYYCDTSVGHPMYNDQYPIVEVEGKTIHCDVPLDPGSNPPYVGNPTIIYYGSRTIGFNNTEYSGAVTHPLTKIVLRGKTSGVIYAQTQADRDGNWSILVNNQKVPQGESLVVVLTKVDLTTLTKKNDNNLLTSFSFAFSKAIFAQEVSNSEVTLEPILRYIEGYAYDKTGKIISFAKVVLKSEATGFIEYQTNADKDGYFTIPPQYIPIFSYYLEIMPPNSIMPVKYTTSEFVQKNESYLNNNKINLLTATKNNKSIINIQPQITSSLTESPTSGLPQNGSPTGIPFIQPDNKTLMIYVAIVFLLLIIFIIIGIFIYIKKKNQEGNNYL